MPSPHDSAPPSALVPLPPVVLENTVVRDWRVCATWGDVGLDARPRGHRYVLDVIAAAAASREVWEALAEATLAGLCMRCTSREDANRMIGLYVAPTVLEHADEFVWAHAPVLGMECRKCSLTEHPDAEARAQASSSEATE